MALGSMVQPEAKDFANEAQSLQVVGGLWPPWQSTEQSLPGRMQATRKKSVWGLAGTCPKS